MATVPPAGDSHDFYACQGSEEFAVFPAGLVQGYGPAPIALQRGDLSWGARHIATKHGKWLDLNKLEVHEMVWKKLRESGAIYNTEVHDKLKLSLRLSPTSLLILRYIAAHNFFTVVSVYAHPQRLDGTMLAKWPGQAANATCPAFCLPTAAVATPAPAPLVTIKKRRTYEKPD